MLIQLGAGLAVVVVGLALRAWSMATLRRHGIVTPFDLALPLRRPHGWATTGPYRLLAHPMYTAHLLVIAGAGVLGFGAPGVLLALPALPYYQSRAVLEGELRRRMQTTGPAEPLRAA